jgi:putative salt-induced outer membrane protein YdiY
MPSSKVEPAPTANFPLVLPGVSLRDGIGAIPTAPSTPPVPKLWEGGLNVGLDGAEGNSEAFNFRFGVQSKRKTEQNILTFTSDYLKQTAKTIPTTNRSYSDGRYEWLFPQSRWSCYGHETIEYNEFTSYNVLDTTDAGLGYRLIKNENTTLVGRFGGGFSNYCGGPDDGNVFPEAVFGVNLERKITKRQKFLGSVEYAVDVVDTLRYRLRTQAALEILLDESINLSMKLGVLESYNSLQQGTRGNDLDYAALVLWKF